MKTMFKKGNSVRLVGKIKCNNLNGVLNIGETGIVKNVIDNQYTVIAVQFSSNPVIQYVVPGMLEKI